MDKKEYFREYAKKYRRTKKGRLSVSYGHMKSRVAGKCPKGKLKYKGLPILSREEFYIWSNSKEFDIVYAKWRESNFIKELTPTIDRLDNTKGYTIGNIRWCSLNENSRKPAIVRRLELTNKIVQNILSDYIPYIFSRKQLSKKYNIPKSTIQNIIDKKSWKHING